MHLGSFEEAETLLLETLNKVCTDYTAFATMGPLNLVKFVFYFHFFGDAYGVIAVYHGSLIADTMEV